MGVFLFNRLSIDYKIYSDFNGITIRKCTMYFCLVEDNKPPSTKYESKRLKNRKRTWLRTGVLQQQRIGRKIKTS